MLSHPVQSPVVEPSTSPYSKKLIEVALPLAAINAASSREKSLRHGHPSTLHLWWARRPLAACRAVLFSALVDDPSAHRDRFPSEPAQDAERERLFAIIERLVQWENTTNEHVLAEARAEIRRCVGDELPCVYDPFCGGGAIPIESQRLGMPTLASDINPVAVLITKALTEIPWRFRGVRPVHPTMQDPISRRTWTKASGLAADVEAYGREVFATAREMLAPYYPLCRTTSGATASVIAWIWARTVICPNPVCGATMPLVKKFALSTRRGNEWCLTPQVDRARKTVRFETTSGKPDHTGTMTLRRTTVTGAVCCVCDQPVDVAYIRAQGKAKRMGTQLLAIATDGGRGRVYVSPNDEHEQAGASASPSWAPETDLPTRALGFRVQAYGLTKHRELFTERQLMAMTTFSDIIKNIRARIEADALAAGMRPSDASLESGASGASAYASAVATYLALALDRLADYSSNLCSWNAPGEKMRNVFSRQTLSMTWDFAEVNRLAIRLVTLAGHLTGSQSASRRPVPVHRRRSTLPMRPRHETLRRPSSSLIRPTTITSHMRICQISSTSGSELRSVTRILNHSQPCSCPNGRSW